MRQECCTAAKKNKRLKKEHCWEIQKEHLTPSTLLSPATFLPVNMPCFGCRRLTEVGSKQREHS